MRPFVFFSWLTEIGVLEGSVDLCFFEAIVLWLHGCRNHGCCLCDEDWMKLVEVD